MPANARRPPFFLPLCPWCSFWFKKRRPGRRRLGNATLGRANSGIIAEVAKLKMPDIKPIGDQIHFHPTGRTKAAMVSSLENWASDIKLSAGQSSFSLTGAGT
jgi:hypothetical protein